MRTDQEIIESGPENAAFVRITREAYTYAQEKLIERGCENPGGEWQTLSCETKDYIGSIVAEAIAEYRKCVREGLLPMNWGKAS